jgi:solute carrier family 25 iron transporter 28/37
MSASKNDSVSAAVDAVDTDDDDWEEWDRRSPFWIHCVAGSVAGVVEHTAVYPLDTVRTHIQVCASCIRHHPANPKGVASVSAAGSAASNSLQQQQHASHKLPTGMWQTVQYLTKQPAASLHTTTTAATTSTTTFAAATTNAFNGYTRLWRGVQTVLVGCIPAHALYFSSYEAVKAATTDARTGQVSAVGSSLAGAVAVTAHDMVLTPLDTLKQRLQMGYYEGTAQAARHIIRQEGVQALYKSFPVTLATNIPYGMVMVATHEMCKQAWQSDDIPAWQTVMASSSVAGCLAATVTTPLDRVKTALQTQQLGVPACHGSQPNCPLTATIKPTMTHGNVKDAVVNIYKHEGLAGFGRGMLPRILQHTPAVAISWTVYETAKNTLMRQYDY